MSDIYFVPESTAYCTVTLDNLFGKEVEKLNFSCNKIMKNWLHKYDGCYISPYKPKLRQVRNLPIPEGASIISEYKKTADYSAVNFFKSCINFSVSSKKKTVAFFNL